jgi:P4 family phage/plasmid primase-like protien
MIMKWSTIKNQYDIKCQLHEGTLEDFADYVKEVRGDRKDGEAILCAEFANGKRELASVVGVYALMFDWDSSGPDITRASEVMGLLAQYSSIVYTTHSHWRPGMSMRIRAFVPMTRAVTEEEYRVLWAYVNSQLEIKPDTQARDACRLNYLRRIEAEDANADGDARKKPFFHFIQKELLNPDVMAIDALVEADREKNARRRERDSELAKWRASNSSDEFEWVEGALNHINSDDREMWRDVGMALKRAGEDEGLTAAFGLWDAWSRSSEKYDARKNQTQWDGFRGASPSGVVTLGSVWHYATEGGWEPPRKEKLADVDLSGAHWTGLIASPEKATQEVVLKSNGDRYLCHYILDKLGAKDSRIIFDGNRWQAYDDRLGIFVEKKDLVYKYTDGLHGSAIDMPAKDGEESKLKYLDSSHAKCKSVEAKAQIVRYEDWFFDKQRAGLSFTDGFFDSVKCELREHSPTYRATVTMGIPYPTSTHAPSWEQSLRDTLSEQDAQAFEEYLGLSIMGRATHIQRSLFLVGAGSNGKSTLIEAAIKCFPEAAVASVSPHQISGHKSEYYLHGLRGKLLNVVSELESSDVQSLGAFKAIVSGDSTSGRPAFGQIQRFKPIAGHVFACNKLPNAGDSSDGFWRRAVVIQFDRQFTDHDKDPAMPMKLAAERSAIIGRLLVAGQNALERGDIIISTKSKEATDDWRLRSSPVLSFLHDCHDKLPAGKIQASELYKTYTKWAEENGRGRLSSTNFGVEIQSEGCVKSKSSSYYYDLDPWRLKHGLTALEVPF